MTKKTKPTAEGLADFWVEVRPEPALAPKVTSSAPEVSELGWGYIGLLHGNKEVSRERAKVPMVFGEPMIAEFEFLEPTKVSGVALWLSADDNKAPMWQRDMELYTSDDTHSLNISITLTDESGIATYMLRYFRRDGLP